MREKFKAVTTSVISLTLIFNTTFLAHAAQPLSEALASQPVTAVSSTTNSSVKSNAILGEDFFIESGPLSAATACSSAICGISAGQTVSGTILVQPNLDLNPDIKKVAYYLNGNLSTREYTSPFIWGGNSGFNTATLNNGNYTLGGAYTTKAGDQAFSFVFTVNNSTNDTTPPIISAVNTTNIEAGGATVNWTTDEASDSQVQYRVQGLATWTTTNLATGLTTNHSVTLTGLNAGTIYQYQALSKDQAGNLSTQATISTFATLGSAPPAGDFTGLSEGQTVIGIITVQPNLTLHPDIRKVFYYLNGTQAGKYYAAPFTWGGTGFNTTTLTNGNHTLAGSYTDNSGDHGFSIAFIVNNSGPADTTPPVISAVTSTNVTTGGATITWITDEASDSQIEYRVQGQSNWLASAINAAFVTNHSISLSGWNASTTYEYRVKSKDGAGNLATQAVISTVTTVAQSPATDFTGLTPGQTVSGTITVQPNLTLHADIRKVFYYLDGTQSGKYYTAPFTWGGTGFNTTTLTNGNHTLAGSYTDNSGDHGFSIAFIVNNSGPADTTPPVISAVTSTNVTTGGATITWLTDEASDSQVQYRVQGATTWLNTVLNTSLVINHSVSLSGLNGNTVYEYQVKSKDAVGNLATQTALSSFKTLIPDTASGINDLAFSELTSSGITFIWTTNQPSDTQLDYRELGSTTWRRWVGGTDYVTIHSLSLIRLSGNKTYEYQAISQDSVGNQASSPVSMFTTLSTPTTAPIYMFGDSIVQWTDWQANLNRLDVINGGIAGQTTAQFLNRMQNVYAAQPKVVFLMGGSNDFPAGVSVQTVFNNMVQIVQDLISQNIRPVIVSTTHVDISRTSHNQQVTQLNALLKDYAAIQNLDYMDLDSQISADEHILPQYTVDGEHFTQAAYDIWEAKILDVLAKYGI